MKRSTHRNIFVNSAAIRTGVPACILQSDLPPDAGHLLEIFARLLQEGSTTKVPSPEYGLTEPRAKRRAISDSRHLAGVALQAAIPDQR